MADLEIHLLGQFQVILNDEIVSNFVSDKARALLAYLAVEGRTPQRRETLAHLLWPDKTDTRARANLRRALTNLRQVIGDTQADAPYLLATHQDIKVIPSPRVWVDVDILSRINDIKKLTPENINQLNQVLDIYQAGFLTGFNIPGSLPFDEWALLKREQYARMMDAVLKRASSTYEKWGEYELALPYAWRHVELEPWQENARRQLMRLLVFIGKRDEALQQYLDLENALQSELKITPGPKTRKLYESILAGEDVFPEEITAKPDGEPAFLPEFLRKKQDHQVHPTEIFVGRQDELCRMNAQLEAMIAERGNILMISGEAGSGKTTLVREFVRQAQSRYPNLVSASGYSNAFTGAGDPYLPFREILYQLSGDIETHWKAGSFDRQYAINLWNTIPITCQSLLTYGPDLIDTLIPGQALLEFAQSYYAARPPWLSKLAEYLHDKGVSPGGAIQQASLFSQFAEVIQKISLQVPMLLFLDDLQWADTGTLGLLFQFVKHIEQSRIMLVGAYRAEEVSSREEGERHPLVPLLNEIQREYGDVFINLGLRSGRDFIQDLLMSEPNELGETFRKELYMLTGGNALFTIELLHSLRESGELSRDGRGMWVMRSDMQMETLPPQTEGIIAQRISRLPLNLQRLLTIASIEGEVFTAEIAAGVAGWPVNQVVSLLSDQLDKQHRLVSPQQVSLQDDRPISTYRFRHFLFQKYLYYRLDKIQRRILHEQVGDEMEKIAGENKINFAVHLARHFHKANQQNKALTYYTLAGTRAAYMSAYPEAINHYEAAIRILLALPDNHARNEKELDLQLKLGLAYQATLGYANEKVGQAYHRAWELCPSVGDVIKRKTTIQLLFSYYANIADFEAAERSLGMLEKDYDQLDEVNPEFAISLHLGHGYLDSIFGKHQSVSDQFEEAIKYYEQVAKQSPGARVGVEPGIFCHGWAGLHQNWLGYPEKAKEHIRSILRIAEGYQLKLFTKDALWLSAWISLEMGDIVSTRKFTDTLLELCIKEHYFLYEGVARIFKGRILSMEGKHQEAIGSIQAGLEMYYLTGFMTFKPDWLYFLAEIYCAAGQVEDGLKAISDAEQIVNETGEGRYKSALQRVKGGLFLLNGEESAAEEAYLNAIEIAQKESTKLFELEAVKGLSRLWARQGKQDQAKRKLQEVYDWFTEGFDTPIMIETRKLLDNLST